MIGRVNEIRLKAKQRRALQVIVSRPSEAAGLVRRARAVLLSDDGVPAGEIAMRLGLTAEAVSRIRRRFLHSAVKGLSDRPKAGRKDHALSPETVDKLVHLAMSPPPAGRARWTTRLLARQFGISSGAVRSEEHTSELQSLAYLVCRLLLEKKKKKISKNKQVETHKIQYEVSNIIHTV